MTVKITKKGDGVVKFNVKGIDISMANALRRIIISRVPIMAIEEVLFYDNSSILNDELLVHRLGLIPLKTDLKTYNFRGECTCKGKGCAKCTVILTLDIQGPCTVHSGDLKSKDPEIVPVYDRIPIVKLTKNQGIKLEAKAQLGTGSEHIKWQGGLASYHINKNKSFDFFAESYGQLTPVELIQAAMDVLNEEIHELKRIIK